MTRFSVKRTKDPEAGEESPPAIKEVKCYNESEPECKPEPVPPVDIENGNGLQIESSLKLEHSPSSNRVKFYDQVGVKQYGNGDEEDTEPHATCSDNSPCAASSDVEVKVVGGKGVMFCNMAAEDQAGKKADNEQMKDTVKLMLVNGKNENNAMYLYENEGKQRPRMNSFLGQLGSYDTTMQLKKTSQGADLSTLMGVYFPCLQNILGVILFIRMPWIVGQAGVVQACMIIGVCCFTTFLTAISMSAIATNGNVPAGGSYFMISRSLGPQFGGAVGIIFFLGVSFAASMYIVGAVEILLNYLIPQMAIFAGEAGYWHNMRIYGFILLILLTAIVAVGVKYVNKLATIFLACVIVSIVCIWGGMFASFASQEVCRVIEGNASFLTKVSHIDNCTAEHTGYADVSVIGGLTKFTDFSNFKENLGPYYMKSGESAPGYISPSKPDQTDIIYNDATTSFAILLAIFFPSVTGIMAGSNRSGDLKDAQTSIPRGTLAAQLTTTSIYLLTAVFCGAAGVRDLLVDKLGSSIDGKLIMALVAFPHPQVVLFGCLLSTIGAALQSLIGAPRLLYAIAKDDVVPILKFFGVASSNGEPLRALFATFCIAGIGCGIGNVDLIAPIITMFFLVCYSFVNLACTLQSLLNAPNWRPRFTLFHWTLSALGLCMCLGVMFLSNWYYALAALGIAAAIYKYIEFKGAEKEWGDGLRGLALQAARYSLLGADVDHAHVKNWRPQMVVLLSCKEHLSADNASLLSFARSLKAGNGLIIVGTVIPCDLLNEDGKMIRQRTLLDTALRQHKLQGFVQITCEESVSKGTTQLLQTCGLGGLKPNTVLMGWPENWRTNKTYENFSRVVRCANMMSQSVLVAKGEFPQRKEKMEGTIDLWWVVHDGGMMLLLAHLISKSKIWKNTKLRIFTVAQLEDDSLKMKADLRKILYELRIDANVSVIEMSSQDISPYTYERTITMAERTKMMEQMGLSKRQVKRTFSYVAESAHKPGTSGIMSEIDEVQAAMGDGKVTLEEEYEDESKESTWLMGNFSNDASGSNEDNNRGNQGGNGNQGNGNYDNGPGSSHKYLAGDVEMEEEDEEVPRSKVRISQLKSDQLLAMDTSVKLNQLVKEHSSEAAMIMLNMPAPPTAANKQQQATSDANYVEFLDVLTEGLGRVLLVRGSGMEVVTVYS